LSILASVRHVLFLSRDDCNRYVFFFFFQAEDGIRDDLVTGVQTCALPISAFQLDLAKFESRQAQVVGISTDFPMASSAWSEKLGVTFPLVSDLGRKTLDAYGILDTDPNSRLYRYAKRAYLIIDKKRALHSVKVLDNPRELIANDDLLAELEKLK